MLIPIILPFTWPQRLLLFFAFLLGALVATAIKGCPF